MTLPFTASEIWSALGQIALASLLGAAVGIERRRQAQVAGLRTQMVLCAASCLVMQVSLAMPRLSPGSDAVHIAQSVLQGIGFLGAGVIVRSGFSVHGVTTAVSIWAVAAIGLAVGAGMLVHAVALAILASVGLVVLEPLENSLTQRRGLRRIVLESSGAPGLDEQFRTVLKRHRIHVQDLGIERNLERQRFVMTAVASCPEKLAEASLIEELSRLGGVVNARLE